LGTREDARECQHFDRRRGIFRWDRYGEGIWRLFGPYGAHGLRREGDGMVLARRRLLTWGYKTSIIGVYSRLYLQ
jgi:hypothetical protein